MKKLLGILVMLLWCCVGLAIEKGFTPTHLTKPEYVVKYYHTNPIIKTFIWGLGEGMRIGTYFGEIEKNNKPTFCLWFRGGWLRA